MNFRGMLSFRLALAGALLAGSPAGAIVPFTEEALARGINYVMGPYPQEQGYVGQGVAFADLDGDGDPDVVLLGRISGTPPQNGKIGIFENVGNGAFVDRSATSGFTSGFHEMEGVTAADYDADGKIDLYITQHMRANQLWRNLGGFVFSNVTTASGTAAGNFTTTTGAAWGDYDNDGWLDLYVCGYGQQNYLLRNNGNGTFTDQAAAQGVQVSAALSFQAVWTDYDRDGDVDLYLSNDRAAQPGGGFPANMLWRNDNGTLVNVSAGSGADVAIFSMGIGAGDIDNNAYTDLYLTNIWALDASGQHVQYDGKNPLLLNQGNGTYLETYTAGVENQISSWAAIFFDFDNDAFTDLYVNNQFEPNNLFRNPGVLPCTEVSAGVESAYDPDYDFFEEPPDLPTIASYTAAVADVNGDGAVDLITNNLGHRAELFINNEGILRNYVRYAIVGEYPNRNAVGAGVETTAGGRVRFHEVFAGGNGYLGQNELTVNVGLGTSTKVTQAVFQWPAHGPTRTLTNLPANKTWKIYPPSRLCDADGDGVDHDDFDSFAGCFLSGFTQGCEMMDFNGESAITVGDLDECFVTSPADCNGNGTEDLVEVMLDLSLDTDDDYAIDCCDGGPTPFPNSVGSTLYLGKSGGTVANLIWTSPPVDGSHAAASSFDVFRATGLFSFAPIASVASPSHSDPQIPALLFSYLIQSRNSCGSSGEEPF